MCLYDLRGTGDLNKYFSNKPPTNSQQASKEYSVSLLIREEQVKATSHHLTPATTVMSQKTKNGQLCTSILVVPLFFSKGYFWSV